MCIIRCAWSIWVCPFCDHTAMICLLFVSVSLRLRLFSSFLPRFALQSCAFNSALFFVQVFSSNIVLPFVLSLSCLFYIPLFVSLYESICMHDVRIGTYSGAFCCRSISCIAFLLFSRVLGVFVSRSIVSIPSTHCPHCPHWQQHVAGTR